MSFFRYAAFALGATFLAAAAAVRVGNFRWSRGTARAVEILATPEIDGPPSLAFSLEELDELPVPVARYFRYALTLGQLRIRRATLEQIGTMRSDVRKPWAPFRAVQKVATRPPSFIWDATMPIGPLVSLRIRDAYLRGEGASEASIAGIIPIGRVRGSAEVASASLVRYLAEAAWLPTALLPSKNLNWTAIDEQNARVTLTDARTTVSIDVRFGSAGEIESISTMRYRDDHGMLVLTPWAGRYRDYRRVAGMMIPMAAEVGWTIGESAASYWRGEITDIRYEFELAEFRPLLAASI